MFFVRQAQESNLKFYNLGTPSPRPKGFQRAMEAHNYKTFMEEKVKEFEEVKEKLTGNGRSE